MKKVIIGLIIVIFGIIVSVSVNAQPSGRPGDPPSTKGNNGPPVGPVGAPIEPGTGLLLLLAAAYGLKKGKEVKNMQ